MRARYKELIERYGLVAVLVYLTTSLCVFLPCLILLETGVDVIGWFEARGWEFPESVATAGNVFLAWLVVKATQIPRLVVTAAVTPIVGQYIKIPMPGIAEADDEADGEGADAADAAVADVSPDSPAPEPKQA